MRSSDLFELIRSMTPGEKRDFKKKSPAGREGDKPNYLDLFDILDGMSKYDENAVKAQLRNPVYAKNLSFGKNYLYHQLLGSLRGLYAHAKPYPNPQIIVADYWAQVQILLRKKPDQPGI
ncbi:MAG: hypothetical protein IPJ40_02745 [Saprospirales bacterium]|nr:hypothetical protein [Saprospirales bacterium]